MFTASLCCAAWTRMIITLDQLSSSAFLAISRHQRSYPDWRSCWRWSFAKIGHPMNSHRLRQIAEWLLERFVDTDLFEPLVGDLIEQHHDGRSSVWFWRQVLILLFGGRTMVRFGVTLLSIVFLIVVTTRMALAGLLHPSDWHTSLQMLESYICLIVLLLLIQRAIWRSFHGTAKVDLADGHRNSDRGPGHLRPSSGPRRRPARRRCARGARPRRPRRAARRAPRPAGAGRGWPSPGAVEIDDAALRVAPDLELVALADRRPGGCVRRGSARRRRRRGCPARGCGARPAACASARARRSAGGAGDDAQGAGRARPRAARPPTRAARRAGRPTGAATAGRSSGRRRRARRRRARARSSPKGGRTPPTAA